MIFQSRLCLGYISFAVPFTDKDGVHSTKVQGGVLTYYKPIILLALCVYASTHLTRFTERLMRQYDLTLRLLESTEKQLSEYQQLYKSRFKTMKEIEQTLQLANTNKYLKNLGQKYYANNKKELPSVQQMTINQATDSIKTIRNKKQPLLKSMRQGDESSLKDQLKEMNKLIEDNDQVRKMVYDSACKYDLLKDFEAKR